MRARNIKPGYFTSDHLLACDPLARILFAGLWCMADREGRLEDRPAKIKVEILPGDACDINELLNQLADQKEDDGTPALLIRYHVDGKRYLQIRNFGKHQNPHCKEGLSTIPGPCEHCVSTGQEQGKPDVSTVQAPDQHSINPADSLIPDSGFLIPDSKPSPPPPPPSAAAPGVVAGKPATGEAPEEPDLAAAKVKPCPHEKIVAIYHEVLPRLPPVKVWNEQRRQFLQARWREDPEHQSLDWWRGYFEKVARCPWLLGDGPENGWKANMEWLIRPTNFAKVLEGQYERSGKKSANRYIEHDPGKFEGISICIDTDDDDVS